MGRSARWLHRLNLLLIVVLLLSAFPAEPPAPAQAAPPMPRAAMSGAPATAPQSRTRPEAERTGTTARFNSYLPLIVAAPTPRTATTIITPEQGGTLTVEALTISVPAGAVSTPATLTYTGAPLGTDSPLRFRLDAVAHTGVVLSRFAQPIQISYTPDSDADLATYTFRHRSDATQPWHILTTNRQLQRVASLVAEADQPGEFWLADKDTPSLVKVAWSADSNNIDITAVTIGGSTPQVIVREDGIERARASAATPYDRNETTLSLEHRNPDNARTFAIEVCSGSNCRTREEVTVTPNSSDEITFDTDIGEGASNPQAFIESWRAEASGGPRELGKPLAPVEPWNSTETQRYFYDDGDTSIARAVLNPVCGNVYIVRGSIHNVYVENQSVGYPVFHEEPVNRDQFPEFVGRLNRFTDGVIAQKEGGDYAVYPYPPAVGYIFLEFVPVPNGDEDPTEATLKVTALVLANFGDRQATDPLDVELTLSINGGDSDTVAMSSEDGFQYTYTSDERYAIGGRFDVSVQVDVTNSTTNLTAKKSVPGSLTVEAGEFQLDEDFPPDPNSSEACTPVDQLPPDNPPAIRIHKVWNNGEGAMSVQVEATDDIGIASVVLQSDTGTVDSDTMTPRPEVGANIYEGVIRDIPPSDALTFVATAIDTAGQTASVDQSGRVAYSSLFGDDCEAQCKEGNPVNTALGNDTDTYTDLIVAGRGGTDILIERTTNSQDVGEGPFGRGSSLYYDMGLEVVDTLLLQGIQIRYGDGRTANFADDGNGRFNPVSLSNFDYITRDGDGYILHQTDRTTFAFDGAGKLREIRTANGVPTTLAYDGAGKLSTITNASGRSVQLIWTGEFISEIRAPEGKTLRYAYEGNLLRFFTDARGNTTEYQYDSNGYVTAVITPNGYPHVRQALDERGRVLWQIIGDAERRDFSYDDATRTTRVTDANGNTTTYVYNASYFIQQVTDARGNSNASEYDARGNLIRYTNRRGFTWTYEYDANGNRIAQTEPVDQFSAVYYTADRSTWLYNEANDLLQHTDALGFSTRFTYDANGNLLSVERPDGSVMTMTYNAFGQIETLTDGLGNTSINTYDATTGDLIAVQDALGNITRFGYDGLGRQISVTDGNGNTVTMVYNGNDQVTEIEDARGGTITFVYDANGNLSELYDRLGARTLSRYDTSDRLIEEIDPVGSTTRYSYDAMGYLTSSTNPRGFRREYQYDALYNITGMRDEANNWWYTEYDNENNPVVEIASDGGRTTYTYDAVDRVKFLVDAEGHRYEYCYDAEDQLIRAFDPRRAKTDFVYDPVGRLNRIVNPLGATYDWLYNAVGQVVAETNGEGETNRYVYDAANRLQQAINPLGYTITFERDGVGNVTRLQDAMGNATRYAFDSNNNLTSVTNALSDVVRMTYDPRDQITSVSEPDGDTSTFSYYPDGTPQFSVRPDGTQLEYRYDENKNPVWIKDTDGQISTFTYDPRDLLVRQTNPNNQTSYYLHDAMLRLVSATDAEGNRSAYAYNKLGWLTSVTDAISSTTTYLHDQVGNTTAITYSNGTTTTFTFNFLNQMVREINGLDHSWIYHYDRAGRLVRQVDGDWRAIRYRYDDAGRMTSAEHVSAGKQVDFSYDRNGNMTAMRDWNGTLRRTYDAINRPIRETDYRGISIGSTWNGDGTRASMQYPDGRTLRYAHDVNNRVQELLLPDGGNAQYAYTPRDQIQQMSFSNGTQSAFQYDAAGRLTDLKTTGVDESILSWYQFTLDEVGNRTRIVEERQELSPEPYAPATRRTQHDFVYDEVYRLREAVVSGDVERTSLWDFDAAGNIMRRTVQTAPSGDTGDTGDTGELIATDYQHDALNALVRAGATSFGYNQSGNRIASTTPITQSAYAPLATSVGVSATVVVSHTYDFAQRLEQTYTAIRTTLPDGSHAYSPTMHARNVYDGFGRRVEQHNTTYITTTMPLSATAPLTQAIFYAYNGLDTVVYEEYRSSSQPTFTRSYYHANGMIVAQDQTIAGYDPTRLWYHHDGLGSVVALTNDAGELVTTYEYDEYGMLLAGNTALNSYTYTGQPYDRATGLYHFYARSYDPANGVWLQQDPYRGTHTDPISQMRYMYVGGNPVNLVDPLGNWGLPNPFNAIGDAVNKATDWVEDKVEDAKDWAEEKVNDAKQWVDENQDVLIKGAVMAGAMVGTAALCVAMPGVGCAIGGALIAGANSYANQVVDNAWDGNGFNWNADAFTKNINWADIAASAAIGALGAGSGALAGKLGSMCKGSVCTAIVNGSMESLEGIAGQFISNIANPCVGLFDGLLESAVPVGAVLGSSPQVTKRLFNNTPSSSQIGRTTRSMPNDVCSFKSFSEDTLVATPEGDTPISELRPGDTVYAFNEETQTTGVYTVTASWMHFDHVSELTINDETIETTADHPFYVEKYGWKDAGELPTGAPIKSLNKSTNGVVQDVRTLATSQPMYNITVDEAQTYYVGAGKWLVHNCKLSDLPIEIHHLASDKNIKGGYTEKFEKIAGKYGLVLDSDWNKVKIPHKGRHPNEYHDWTLNGMKQASQIAGKDKDKFLAEYNRLVRDPVTKDPMIVRKEYWR